MNTEVDDNYKQKLETSDYENSSGFIFNDLAIGSIEESDKSQIAEKKLREENFVLR